jgi:hypothetical protein
MGALALAVVLTFLQTRPDSTAAIQETGYTLPFFTNWQITCNFGVPYSSCDVDLPGTHQGIDYDLGVNDSGGEAVAAAAGGIAKGCPSDIHAGWTVLIDHGNQNRTRYLHLRDHGLPLEAGQDVMRGEIVGFEGSTGDWSEGPHLHFETRQGATTFDCTNQQSGSAVNPNGLWQDGSANHADFAPAVATYTYGRTDVFVRGRNNDLYQKTWTGSWTGWGRPKPNQCLRSAPAATARDGRIDVFFRGCDNDIWRVTRLNGSWSSASRPLPGRCTLNAPAATSWSTTRIDVFYRGCDNVLYEMTWNGSSWTQTVPIAGTCLLSGPGAVAPGYGRFDIAYRGCDNAVYLYLSVWLQSRVRRLDTLPDLRATLRAQPHTKRLGTGLVP